MTDCLLELNPNGLWQCTRCGWVYPIKSDKPPRRNCPALAASRGLGDTIAKVTKFFGVRPCRGCEKRRRRLNELWPYKRGVE